MLLAGMTTNLAGSLARVANEAHEPTVCSGNVMFLEAAQPSAHVAVNPDG